MQRVSVSKRFFIYAGREGWGGAVRPRWHAGHRGDVHAPRFLRLRRSIAGSLYFLQQGVCDGMTWSRGPSLRRVPASVGKEDAVQMFPTGDSGLAFAEG